MSDAAIATIVTGIVTVVTTICGVITLWIKLRKSDKKIDDNTEMTKIGSAAAVKTAAVAASAATEAAEKTDALIEQMNGKLEARITAIVRTHTEPIATAIRIHTEQDDKNMVEIRTALGELRDRTK